MLARVDGARRRGLGVSKWLHNAGSVMLMLAFVVLIALPFVHMARGTLPDYHPFAVAMPALSLFSLNVFGKLAMGALSGFEYVAVLAGETKDRRADDRPGDDDRRADHRGDVHSRNERRAGVRAGRSDQSDRPHSAGAAHRVRRERASERSRRPSRFC